VKNFKTYLLAAAGIGIVSLTLSLTNTGRVLAENIKPLLVTVVNDSTTPVPVRDIDNPARQPFQIEQIATIRNAESSWAEFVAVPIGKRLVIEYVSVFIALPAGQKPTLVGVATTLNQIGAGHSFGAMFLAADIVGRDVFNISQQTRLYSDPGASSVNFFVERNASSGEAEIFFSVSGYLVDLQ